MKHHLVCDKLYHTMSSATHTFYTCRHRATTGNFHSQSLTSVAQCLLVVTNFTDPEIMKACVELCWESIHARTSLLDLTCCVRGLKDPINSPLWTCRDCTYFFHIVAVGTAPGATNAETATDALSALALTTTKPTYVGATSGRSDIRSEQLVSQTH